MLKLKIVKADGTTQVLKVGPRVIVAFERHFKAGYGKALEERRMEHFLWLAWESERVAGLTPQPFDEWINQVDDIEAVDDDDPPTSATA